MRATNDCTRGKKSSSWDLGTLPEAERDTKQEELFLPKGNFFVDTALASSSYFIIFIDSFSALNLYTELSMRINVRVD